LAKTQKINIVWVPGGCYDEATRFKTQAEADAAAARRSREKKYGHESVFCDREHKNKTGGLHRKSACWHVQGRVRPEPKGFEGVRLTSQSRELKTVSK
jgi:hypothetical protein